MRYPTLFISMPKSDKSWYFSLSLIYSMASASCTYPVLCRVVRSVICARTHGVLVIWVGCVGGVDITAGADSVSQDKGGALVLPRLPSVQLASCCFCSFLILLDHTGPRGRSTPKLSSVNSQQNTRLVARPGEDIRNNIKYLSEMLGGFYHYHSKVWGTLWKT